MSLSRALADRARRLAALAERARARNEEDVLYALRLLVSGALVVGAVTLARSRRDRRCRCAHSLSQPPLALHSAAGAAAEQSPAAAAAEHLSRSLDAAKDYSSQGVAALAEEYAALARQCGVSHDSSALLAIMDRLSTDSDASRNGRSC